MAVKTEREREREREKERDSKGKVEVAVDDITLSLHCNSATVPKYRGY